jgi:ceramide glucosyltransferase
MLPGLTALVIAGLEPSLRLASLISLAYVAVAITRLRRFGRRRPTSGAAGVPVSVLKPLCGDEPLLYENLRSFCDQDYPRFEVILGVRDAADPAISVVERLREEFPDLEIQLIVDDRVHGHNRKASNLANMSGAAKYDALVLADSDMRVDRGYLATVTAPLADPRVGVVTCLYAGQPAPGVWSALGAMFINEWFLPSALVARAMTAVPLCFGSTIVLRREVLDSIGGFHRLADELADDYVLGERVAARGLQIVLSPNVVETVVAEPSFRSLWWRELRWARTIRAMQPLGFALTFVTYAVPLALLCLFVAPSRPAGWLILAVAVGLRVAAHPAARRALGVSAGRAWAAPIRDVLSFAVWASSFFGRRVRWRGHEMVVERGGRLRAGRPETRRDGGDGHGRPVAAG